MIVSCNKELLYAAIWQSCCSHCCNHSRDSHFLSLFLPSFSLSLYIYICTYITYLLSLSLGLSLSLFLRNLQFKVTCSTGHVSTHSLCTILLPRRMCGKHRKKHRNYISYYLHRKVIYNEIKLIVKFTWKKKLIKLCTSSKYRIRALASKYLELSYFFRTIF